MIHYFLHEIEMIATDKESFLYKAGDYLGTYTVPRENNIGGAQNQHLYVTGTSTLFPGDSCIYDGKVGWKTTYGTFIGKDEHYTHIELLNWKEAKKIYATTNPDLWDLRVACKTCKGSGALNTCPDCKGTGIKKIPLVAKIPYDLIQAYPPAYNKGDSIKEIKVEYTEYNIKRATVKNVPPHSPFAPEWMQLPVITSDFKLKLNSNNEIAWHSLKDEWDDIRYSKNDIIRLFHFFNSRKETPNKIKEAQEKEETYLFSKQWVKDNLKN